MDYLFITPRFPYPLTKGDKLRVYHFIKYLSLEGNQIDLISFSENKNEAENINELNNYCRSIHIVYMPKWLSYLNMICLSLNGKPFQVNYYNNSEMHRIIKSICAKNKYDKIILVLLRIAQYCDDLKKNNAEIIIDHIDALSLNMKRRLQKESNQILKLLLKHEVRAIIAWEQKFCHYKSIITSPVDLNEFFYYDNIKVVPNGVEFPKLPDAPHHKKDIDLIFIGNMSYFPNVQAIQFFMQRAFDMIIRMKPDIKFYIVGINPNRQIRRYHDGKNIFVTGFVENISDYLFRSKIFIAPLQSGSGIQNKILEAMAHRVPVITTKYGNFGINAKDGKEIIIAGGSNALVDSTLELLFNNNKPSYIVFNALALLKDKYSWQKIVKTMLLD